jgi:hypothetical protein
MTSYKLELLADLIRFDFVIPGNKPNFSMILYPYLRRSYNVTRRMKRKPDPVDIDVLTEWD